MPCSDATLPKATGLSARLSRITFAGGYALARYAGKIDVEGIPDEVGGDA